MNPAVVITTIQRPTPSIHRWRSTIDGSVFVVADRKTPDPWILDGCDVLSVRKQQRMPFRLLQRLPWNHYARKMIGYLAAIQQGADILIDTDDDNEPLKPYEILPQQGVYPRIGGRSGFVNVYRWFTEGWIWPRGFPLRQVVGSVFRYRGEGERSGCRIGIWQGLVEGEPDVDAIYRIVVRRRCRFSRKEPLVLEKGSICPINSQNTVFFREAFPLLYLPAFVSFRFTDILRGLVAQPILWAADLLVGFTGPTAFQERNPHNLIQDFRSEIPCYLYAEKVCRIAAETVRKKDGIADNLLRVYEALLKHRVVRDPELRLLDAWLEDIAGLGSPA